MMKKELVVGKPKLFLRDRGFRIYCAGCHHALFDRLIRELMEELDIEGNTIAITGVGCTTFTFTFIEVDTLNAPHGRAPDAATALKRIHRGRPVVFTIQGDGDCMAIGAEPLIHAAARGEKITVFLVNNGNYGTTGGQMAPTTLIGQVTTTNIGGRNPEWDGAPIHVAELVAGMRGTVYSARGALNSYANRQRTKQYMKTALQKQIDNAGFSFVEFLSACPTDWHLTPKESLAWVEQKMIPEFPLGEIKNIDRPEW